MSGHPRSQENINVQEEYLTEEEYRKEDKKLYLPKLCIVPLAARLNKNISDSAKIYLGELNVLTNKYGYCYALDEQLAEMKDVSVRTIQNYHKILNDEGFIKRDTWKVHVKTKKGLEIRTKRKIYVFEHGSKKDAEPQEPAPRSEPQESAGRSEPQESAGISKEPLKKEPRKQQQGQPDPKQEEAKPSASLVVVSLLKSLGISKTMQDRVLVNGKYPETQILAACEVLKQAGCNVTNPDAYLQSALNNKHWELKEEVVDEAEERRNENKAKAMLVLATLTDKDVKGGGAFSFDGKIVNINSRERGDFSIDTSKEITKYEFGKSPAFMIIKALGCNPF